MYLVCYILLLISHASHATQLQEDLHVKCKAWSFLGECEMNEGYMLKNCATSCQLYEEALDAAMPNDLYSISEVDFNGNPFHFRNHRDQRLFIVNAAASTNDPFTDANFRLLATLSRFRSAAFEVLLYPSFQLERGGTRDPYFVSFYAQQSGFEGVVMRHVDWNGMHRCDTFKYLMGKTLRGSTLPVRGNFQTKLFIDPAGKIDERASELVTALFTAGRNATLSVDAAAQSLALQQSPQVHVSGARGSSGSGWIDAGGGSGAVLLHVVRELCDRHLCPWFQLSSDDCGQLRMQVLMDVY